MWISKLILANFRNYPQLELDLTEGSVLFCGENGQGKSNLLEAIHILASGKSLRADSDRELVGFGVLESSMPYVRVQAVVEKAEGSVNVDLVIQPSHRADSGGSLGDGITPLSFQKRIAVNGLPRKIFEYLGQVQVVLFSPEDIGQVSGSPAVRRHYLDATLCQLDNRYLRSLQRYNRVLPQRNHLLRRLQEGRASKDELGFWNSELVNWGSYLLSARMDLVATLNRLAPPFQDAMTQGSEVLRLLLIQSLGNLVDATPEKIEELFGEALMDAQAREIERGMSLIGPHRDDLQFLINDVDAGMFSSRGQHRTIIISLRLAQAQLIRSRIGEDPILLLDDIFSELDGPRKEYVLSCIQSYQQVFLSATDLNTITSSGVEPSAIFQVSHGTLSQPEGSLL